MSKSRGNCSVAMSGPIFRLPVVKMSWDENFKKKNYVADQVLFYDPF